jgi:hypothetical protein
MKDLWIKDERLMDKGPLTKHRVDSSDHHCAWSPSLRLSRKEGGKKQVCHAEHSEASIQHHD